MTQEEEYYDGGDEDIDIEKLNELEKENFDNNFESIISFEIEEKPKTKDEKDNLALSISTNASSEENPIMKFNNLKMKIEELEKELIIYSESQNLIQHDETLDEYFERFKKLKDTLNFISNSQNYFELKRIFESNKSNDKNIDKCKLLQEKMIEKKISKISEIKNKLNKIKEKLGNIELDTNKENLISIVKDLKNKIKIHDTDFKKKIEEQKNIINKRVKELDISTEFYDILDKEYLDSLFSGFNNSEEIENIITETVTKMENLKDRHEISAFVGLKLQEMIDQQVKLGNEINDNLEILINLKKNIKNNVEIMKKNLELLKTKLGVK